MCAVANAFCVLSSHIFRWNNFSARSTAMGATFFLIMTSLPRYRETSKIHMCVRLLHVRNNKCEHDFLIERSILLSDMFSLSALQFVCENCNDRKVKKRIKKHFAYVKVIPGQSLEQVDKGVSLCNGCVTAILREEYGMQLESMMDSLS